MRPNPRPYLAQAAECLEQAAGLAAEHGAIQHARAVVAEAMAEADKEGRRVLFFDRYVRPIPGTCAFCSTEKRHSAQRAEYDTESRRIASCSLCPRALAAAAAAS